MSDDVAFINIYNEIVFENFLAVLKQNILFQTQLKITEQGNEKRNAVIEDFEKNKITLHTTQQELLEIKSAHQQLKVELEQQTSQLQQARGSDAERHRVQVALNEKSKQVDVLNKTLQEKNEYILSLEQVIPTAKRKKITIFSEEINTSTDPLPKKNDNGLKIPTTTNSSGGMF